jgi:hypothetical protein
LKTKDKKPQTNKQTKKKRKENVNYGRIENCMQATARKKSTFELGPIEN